MLINECENTLLNIYVYVSVLFIVRRLIDPSSDSVLYDCVRTLELCRVCECDGRWVLPIALCEALVSIKLAGCVGACVGERGWLTRRWEEVRRRETARITFGHLSPFPYIVLRYANVTYKALDRASRTCTTRYTHASYPWIHMNTYVQLCKRTYSRSPPRASWAHSGGHWRTSIHDRCLAYKYM